MQIDLAKDPDDSFFIWKKIMAGYMYVCEIMGMKVQAKFLKFGSETNSLNSNQTISNPCFKAHEWRKVFQTDFS